MRFTTQHKNNLSSLIFLIFDIKFLILLLLPAQTAFRASLIKSKCFNKVESPTEAEGNSTQHQRTIIEGGNSMKTKLLLYALLALLSVTPTLAQQSFWLDITPANMDTIEQPAKIAATENMAVITFVTGEVFRSPGGVNWTKTLITNRGQINNIQVALDSFRVTSADGWLGTSSTGQVWRWEKPISRGIITEATEFQGELAVTTYGNPGIAKRDSATGQWHDMNNGLPRSPARIVLSIGKNIIATQMGLYRWDGDSWEFQQAGEYYLAREVKNGDIYAFESLPGEQGQIWRSQTRGQSWGVVQSPEIYNWIGDIVSVDSSNVWTLGPWGAYHRSQSGLTNITSGLDGEQPFGGCLFKNYLYITTIGGKLFRSRQPVVVTNAVSEQGRTDPDSFELKQSHPNPTKPGQITKFQFTIKKPGQYGITIYNSLGQEISKVGRRDVGLGTHEMQWTAPNNLASGIYFYRLESIFVGQTTTLQTRRLVIVR